MAHPRRSPQHRVPSPSISSPVSRRKYTLRRATFRTSSHASAHSLSSPLPQLQEHRPVLFPLHPNLRRLPSRTYLPQFDEQDKDVAMRESSHAVQVGAKRKRVNENANTHGRSTRGSGRLKRQRSSATTMPRYYETTDEESDSEASEMQIDTLSAQSASDNSDPGEEEDEIQGDHTCKFLSTFSCI